MDAPPTDAQYLKLAIGTILAGLLSLLGLSLKRGAPVLVNRVVKLAVHEEFRIELARGEATSQAVQRMEPKLDQVMTDVGDLLKGQERIDATLREFSRAIGRLEGAGAVKTTFTIPPPDATIERVEP